MCVGDTQEKALQSNKNIDLTWPHSSRVVLFECTCGVYSEAEERGRGSTGVRATIIKTTVENDTKRK